MVEYSILLFQHFVYSSLKIAMVEWKLGANVIKGCQLAGQDTVWEIGRAAVLAFDHFPTSCVDFLPVRAGGNVRWRWKDAISPRCSLNQEVRTVF